MEHSTGLIGNIIFYLILITALALFSYLIYVRIRLLFIARPEAENRFNKIGERIKSILVFVFGQKRLLNETYAGIMHLLIFYGFVVFFLGTITIIGEGLYPGFSLPFMDGAVWNVYLFLKDIFAVLVIIGIAMATYRWLIMRPARLEPSLDAALCLIFIFCLMLTDLLMGAGRIGVSSQEHMSWTPAAFTLSKIFKGIGLTKSSFSFLYSLGWWGHVVFLLGFLVYLPISKHFHILTAIPNVFLRRLGPKGALTKLDLEDETAESFGVFKVEEFTWKQIFDWYSCTECGRCSDNCPANLTEKPLSPKHMTINLKHHLLEKAPYLLRVAKDGGNAHGEWTGRVLLGDVVKEDELWACTTCRACEEQCPVFIEYVQRIIDMRRYLVLTESRFPSEVTTTFRNMENQSNPWGLAYTARADWTEGMGVKILSESDRVDILFYVGCAGSFNDRNKKVSKALVRILKEAGLDFGILGANEKCCGEAARRIGNEYLFQTLAQENVEMLNSYTFNRILTACPHCYNTLRNEYAQFGGRYQVIHHTQLIMDLMEKGKILPKKALPLVITYHDSCYLGRYNDLYEVQRKALTKIPEAKLVEMARNRERSFCCGAGGGRMWMEENLGKRINVTRIEEALSLNPDIIGTACPYCLTMLEDGLKAKEAEEAVRVMDVAELLSDSL